MNTMIDEPGVEIVPVRSIREDDLNAIVRIDAQSTGRTRPRYFQLMLERAVTSAALQVSLVAEREGRVVGFVIASLYYGEYGISEPSASIEAIGVEAASRRSRIAHALLEKLRRNVAAVGVTSIRTEVEWSDFDLLAFLRSEGFSPAPRICLERKVDPTE
jgi:ribosomal protein S18 acetylase RimI-like enzyme